MTPFDPVPGIYTPDVPSIQANGGRNGSFALKAYKAGAERTEHKEVAELPWKHALNVSGGPLDD